jgi:hypothetical protein
VEPITAPVKRNTLALAWVQFYCPKDGKYEDVSVQFIHDGQVRSTADVTVSGFGRTRTWKGGTLSKPGVWTIKVLRGTKELGSTSVTVEN